jgi:hypothetical protein
LKVTNEDLLAAYAELGNVHKVGERFGIRGGSVHERLQKLNVDTSMNTFTTEDEARLRASYADYRRRGKVADLAKDMGRTVYFLSRKAKELGLTEGNRHEKHSVGIWKYMTDETAREMFDSFKASPLGLGQYCTKNGYGTDGFTAAIRTRWPDEWEHVIEAKHPVSTKYRLGRQVEYRFRDMLKQTGYVVMRSPGSKSPIDLIAVCPGQVLFIQCKRSGSLPPKEWNALYDLAISAGALPVMAENPFPREHRFWLLTGRKDGSKKRQPMDRFYPIGFEDPTTITQAGEPQ